jgi:hypothetical protein
MATNSEKKEFVLFFSPSCIYCKNFLGKLKSKDELLKKVNLVDIDNTPELPDEVDEIPCIYDGKNIFKGTGAFKWFDEKSMEYLSPADDCIKYAFINGEEEQVFNNYSLLEQKNGSFGIGENTPQQNKISKSANMSLETLMSNRSMDMSIKN